MSEEIAQVSPQTAGWVDVIETERRCFKNYTEVCKLNFSGGKRLSFQQLTFINPIRICRFGAAHRWGGAKNRHHP